MTAPAIELRGLRKRYAQRTVLDGIDLAVPAGAIQGYIGKNGAGKTTTVKVLIGALTDFEGEVRVAGLDPRAEPAALKRRIGYVPEHAALFEVLTVSETLLFVGRLHGLEDDLVRRRADPLLEAFELSSRLAARVSTLSKGMRQKVLLAAALLHDPDVLFLDEPLSGLDVNAAILVKELLRHLADSGRTVFYCSHVMDVVERLCDRIAILDGGRIAVEGSFEDLRDARGEATLERIFASLTSEGGQGELVQRTFAALRETAGWREAP